MKLSSLKKTFFLTLFLVFNHASFAQTLLLSKEAKISLLTCGTGNESYSLFGHTAIRVTDVLNGVDIVYNYGAFDFGTSNFVLKFTKGNLQYFAVAHSFADFMSNYTYERRSVYEQELAIPTNLKQKLFDNLNQSLQLENREYTYKFIDKNCTSMAVEVINKSLNAPVIVKKGDTDVTYRTILYPYFDNHFYEKLGTSIVFGKKVDELGTKIFLPFELKKSLDQVVFDKHPLVKENKILLEFAPETPFSWWNSIYTYLMLLAIVIGVNKRWMDNLYVIKMGILGCLFLFLGFYSLHEELNYNYNILLFNPSLLALFYFAKTKNRKWTTNLVWFNLISLGAYILILINKAHLWIVLPMIATNVVVLWRRYRKV